VLNVLARPKAPAEPDCLEAARTPLKMAVEPLADVQRYDRLRGAAGETALWWRVLRLPTLHGHFAP
jgi:hypothetical protein